MPEISRFLGIIIRMYWGDHNPPHFHAYFAEHEAEYDIRTLGILKGRLPRRIHLLVEEWAFDHQEELLRNWELCKEELPPEKIEPLA